MPPAGSGLGMSVPVVGFVHVGSQSMADRYTYLPLIGVWDYFRDLESRVCQEFANRDGLVIDTGGGAILRSQNVEALKKTGTLFWLTGAVDPIAQRIGRDTQRASLTGTKSFVDEVQDVLRERTPKYEAAADHVIATDGRSLVRIADEILARL